MGLTDKTRKTLWAKSGNRCAICRIELVQDSENLSDKVIIGEECHIISSKAKGPRGFNKYVGDFDSIENLILLCANDHKRIDELTEVYSVEKLKLFKTDHENWVKSTLERDVIAFTNDKNNLKSLPKIKTGKQIIDLINGVHILEFNHDELKTSEEAEVIGELFDELRDLADIFSEIEFSELAMLGLTYNDVLTKLQKMGFYIFGLRRKIRLRNGKQEDMGVYNSVSLIAVRQDNPAIFDDFLITKFKTEINLK